MVDLSQRSTQAEIMDDFSQSGEVLEQTLRELERINALLGGNDVSTNGLKKLLPETDKSYHIADLGCGGGDMMMLMSRWGDKHNQQLRFSGIDANPSIVDFARRNTADHSNIDYLPINIFSDEFKTMEFDVIHCSLFTHHFTSEELVGLFQQLMKQAKVGLVINDLHRHIISYYFTKWIIRGLSKSSMVRFDSVVSVARSFTKQELLDILKQAGITRFELKWKWAFRWQLVVWK